MEESREEKQKRIEQTANSLLIRTGLENLDKLPNLIPMVSPEIRERIKGAVGEFLPKIRELLPVIKDEIKSAIATKSEEMGAGEGKLAYVFRNGETGLEIWTLRNPKFGGEKVSVFSFKKITDRIDKYGKVEALIGDLLTGKLFSEKDYPIDETPAEALTPPVVTLTATVTEQPLKIESPKE